MISSPCATHDWEIDFPKTEWVASRMIRRGKPKELLDDDTRMELETLYDDTRMEMLEWMFVMKEGCRVKARKSIVDFVPEEGANLGRNAIMD